MIPSTFPVAVYAAMTSGPYPFIRVCSIEQDYINYALHFSLWHLETITGPKKKVLFNKLKEEWFEEFGIKSLSEECFYNKTEYGKYKVIMDKTFEEYEKATA